MRRLSITVIVDGRLADNVVIEFEEHTEATVERNLAIVAKAFAELWNRHMPPDKQLSESDARSVVQGDQQLAWDTVQAYIGVPTIRQYPKVT